MTLLTGEDPRYVELHDADDREDTFQPVERRIAIVEEPSEKKRTRAEDRPDSRNGHEARTAQTPKRVSCVRGHVRELARYAPGDVARAR